jgi:hypothetical protein
MVLFVPPRHSTVVPLTSPRKAGLQACFQKVSPVPVHRLHDRTDSKPTQIGRSYIHLRSVVGLFGPFDIGVFDALALHFVAHVVVGDLVKTVLVAPDPGGGDIAGTVVVEVARLRRWVSSSLLLLLMPVVSQFQLYCPAYFNGT